jgi:hypothetical protein
MKREHAKESAKSKRVPRTQPWLHHSSFLDDILLSVFVFFDVGPYLHRTPKVEGA